MPIKTSKFTEERIGFALRLAELGTAVNEVCRKMRINQATFFRWKQKYGGLGPSKLRKLRQLEEENLKLKRLLWPGSGGDRRRDGWREHGGMGGGA